MTRFAQLKINPIIAGLLILIILAVAGLVLRSLQTQLAPATNQIQPGQITPTQADRKSTASLDINDKTFIIPQNWNLSAVFTSPVGTNYGCVTGNDCHLALITNDAKGAALDKVIISWPVAVTSNFQPTGASVNTQLSFLAETVNFTAYKYYVDDSVALSSQQTSLVPVYSQLYGCTKAGVCIQADLIQPEPEQNAKQMADFKQFLQEFKLQ